MSFILSDILYHLSEETLLERGMAQFRQAFENVISQEDVIQLKDLNLRRRKIGAYCLKNKDLDTYVNYLKTQLRVMQSLEKKGQIEKIAILLSLDAEDALVVSRMLKIDEGQQLFLWLLIYNNEQLQDAEELDIPKSKVREFRQELIKCLATQGVFDIKHTTELLSQAFACLESGVLENRKTERNFAIKILAQLFEYHILENNPRSLADNILSLIDRLPELFKKFSLSGLGETETQSLQLSAMRLFPFVDFDQIKDKIAYCIAFVCAGHAAKDYDLSPEAYSSFKEAILNGFRGRLKFETFVSIRTLREKTKELNVKESNSLSKGIVLLLDYFIYLIDDFVENRPQAFAEKLALGSEFVTSLMEESSQLPFRSCLQLESYSKDGLALRVSTNPMHKAMYWLEQFNFEDDLALYTNTPFVRIQDFRKQVQVALGKHYKQEDAFSLMREKPEETKGRIEQFLLLNKIYLRTAYRERDHKKFAEGIQCLFKQALQVYKAGDFSSLNTLLFLDSKDFGEIIALFEQDKILEIYKSILNKYLHNLSRKETNRCYSDSKRFYSDKVIQRVRAQRDREMVLFVQELYKSLNLSEPPCIAPRYYCCPKEASSSDITEIPKDVAEWEKIFHESLQSKDLNKINGVAHAARNLFFCAYEAHRIDDMVALFKAIFAPLNGSDKLKAQYCKFISQFLRKINLGWEIPREDISRMFQLLQVGSYDLFKAQVLMNIDWRQMKGYKKEIVHHTFMTALFSKLCNIPDLELKKVHELFDRFLTAPSPELQFSQALPELVTYMRYLYVQAMLGERMDERSLAAREKLASMAVKYARKGHQNLKDLPETSFLGALKILFEGFNLTKTFQLPRMMWATLQYDHEANNFLERALLPRCARVWLYEMTEDLMGVDPLELKEKADFPRLQTNPLLPTCEVVLKEIDKVSSSKDKYVAIYQITPLLFEIFAHHISIEDYRSLALDTHKICVYLLEKYKAGNLFIFDAIISAIMDINDDDDDDDDDDDRHMFLSAFRTQQELAILLGGLFSRKATQFWNTLARDHYVPKSSRTVIRNSALTHIQNFCKVQKIVPNLKDLTERLNSLLERPEDPRIMTFCGFEKELILFDAFARRDHKTLAEAIKILTNFSFKAHQKDHRAVLIELFQLTSELSWSKSESHRSEDHSICDQNKRLIRWCYHFNSNNPKQIMIMILKEVFKGYHDFLEFDEYQSLEQAVYEALEITVLDRFDPSASAAESPEELKKIADFMHSQSNLGVNLLKDLESVALVAKRAEFNKLLPKPKTEDSAQYHRVYNKVHDIWHMHLLVHRFSLQSDTSLEGSMDNTMPQQVHDSFLEYLEQKEIDELIKMSFQCAKIEVKQEGELVAQFKNALKKDMQALFLLGEKSSADLKVRFEQGKQLSFPVHTIFSDTTGNMSGHLSAAVFFKLGEQWFMFRSDRGGDTAATESGLNLYRVTKPEDIKSVAEKMAASYKVPIPNETYKALFKDNLGLQKIGQIYKKPQFIGGCGFISAAKPLAQINCLVNMMELIHQNNTTLEVPALLKQAQNAIKPFFSAFSVYDRCQVLSGFINHLKAQLEIQQYDPEELEHIKILLAQVWIMNDRRPARKKIMALLGDENLPEVLRFSKKHLEAANKALTTSFGDLLLGATELDEEVLALKTHVFDKTGKAILSYYQTKQHRDSEELGRRLHEDGAELARTLPPGVLERIAAKKAKTTS